MPLLDGRYEIIAERELGDRQTVFEAIAPDGTAVRVVWFELSDPDQEAAFERYRLVLRRLWRQDLAAIFDIVSRPGAHYVAWLSPADAAPAGRPPPDLAQRLEELGVSPYEADIRTGDQHPRVFDLAFDGSMSMAAQPRADVGRQAVRRKYTPREMWHAVPWGLRRNIPGLVLALVGLVFFWSGVALRSNDQLVRVPELVGTEINDAAQTLHGIGLEVRLEGVPADEAAGEVVSMSPNAGAMLRPGRNIVVRYALPEGEQTSTEVPDLRGRTFGDDLRRRVEDARLELGGVAHVTANVAQGTVLSQSLPPGTRTAEGSTLDILVSDGPAGEVTFLPDLTGLDVDLARALVRDAGLTAEIEEVYVPSARARTGTVLSQSIPPYRELSVGTVGLRLEVAGPRSDAPLASADVPSLVGLPLDEATEVLEEAGYRLGTIDYVGTRALTEGVVSQTPPPGSGGDGGAIDLLVNKFPVALPVPEVTAEVRGRELRRAQFRWVIEPGIASREAVVTATTLAGDEFEVERVEVRGGETVEGTWLTTAPGPITFTLELNGIQYGSAERVNP